MFNRRILIGTAIFSLVMGIIVLTKPQPLFTHNSRVRDFGISKGAGETMFSLHVVSSVVAVLSIAIATMIDILL